jgi:hypothetical protein
MDEYGIVSDCGRTRLRSADGFINGQRIILYSFCSKPDCADGKWPYAGVIQGNDGNFYGTTYRGGGIRIAPAIVLPQKPP